MHACGAESSTRWHRRATGHVEEAGAVGVQGWGAGEGVMLEGPVSGNPRPCLSSSSVKVAQSCPTLCDPARGL